MAQPYFTRAAYFTNPARDLFRCANEKSTCFGKCFFLGAEGGICFSAEKPGWLQQSTGLLLRAAFQIPLVEGMVSKSAWGELEGGGYAPLVFNNLLLRQKARYSA